MRTRSVARKEALRELQLEQRPTTTATSKGRNARWLSPSTPRQSAPRASIVDPKAFRAQGVSLPSRATTPKIPNLPLSSKASSPLGLSTLSSLSSLAPTTSITSEKSNIEFSTPSRKLQPTPRTLQRSPQKARWDTLEDGSQRLVLVPDANSEEDRLMRALQEEERLFTIFNEQLSNLFEGRQGHSDDIGDIDDEDDDDVSWGAHEDMEWEARTDTSSEGDEGFSIFQRGWISLFGQREATVPIEEEDEDVPIGGLGALAEASFLTEVESAPYSSPTRLRRMETESFTQDQEVVIPPTTALGPPKQQLIGPATMHRTRYHPTQICFD